MYMILLRFTGRKDEAASLMAAHKAWIASGFAEGAFVLVGSLKPDLGGALIALSGSRAAIEARVAEDPFVAEGIVDAEILEVETGRVDERLALLATS